MCCLSSKLALPFADHDMVLMKASPHVLHILQASAAPTLNCWVNLWVSPS